MLGSRGIPVLLTLAIGLLVLAWGVGNPPSAAPDEMAHYVKALGVGGGDFVGKAPSATTMAGVASRLMKHGTKRSSQSFRMGLWVWATSRSFAIPAYSVSSAFNCNGQDETRSWACLSSGQPFPVTNREARTYIGSYPPFDYIAPGLLARGASAPDTRLLLGRVGTALPAFFLLAAAIFLLWDQRTGGLSILGFLVGVTPMVVFVSSTLSSSGPEIAASVCFVAALIRLMRDQRAPLWVWLICALSGFVLSVSRQLGPEEVIGSLLAVAVLFGPARAQRLFRSGPAKVTWVLVAIGCAVGILWDLSYGVHPTETLGDVASVLPSAVKQLPRITGQAIGNFGRLDSPLPMPAVIGWSLLVCTLLAASVLVSERPQWRRLAVVTVGVGVCTVVFEALQRQTGFSFQGRYALPLFVIVPLAAGELVQLRSERLQPRVAKLLVVGMIAASGLIQAIGWISNGRRVAVGIDGSWLYVFNAKWQPPLGWLLWTSVVLVSLALYLIAARLGGSGAASLPVLGRAHRATDESVSSSLATVR